MLEPRIIRESVNGYSAVTLQDEKLAHREIELLGEINDNTANCVISQLLYLHREDPEGEITMYINSPGGVVDSGMAIYDVMRAVGCPIRTVCTGMAASMASLIFVSGDTRQMLEHSRIMIHDPLVAHTGGSALQLKAVSDNLMETRNIIADVIARHSGRKRSEILKMTSSDRYFRADEAVKFGLADAIVKSF